MIFEYKYQEVKSDCYECLSNPAPISGKNAQANWLWDQGEMQNNERDRLITLLPLICYEIEHGILTEELLDEVEIYYEDYKAGVFNGLLGDDEIEEIEKDLFWCYEHRHDNPLSNF